MREMSTEMFMELQNKYMDKLVSWYWNTPFCPTVVARWCVSVCGAPMNVSHLLLV